MMNRLFFTMFLVLSSTFVSLSTPAGTNKWTPIGPYGDAVLEVVIDPITPTTAYAETWSGAFRSTDSGATWNLMVEPTAPWGIIPSASIGNTLYGLTRQSKNIYQSTDAGNTWEVTTGQLPGFVHELAVSGTTLYVEVSVHVDTTQFVYRVYKSVDQGNSWTEITCNECRSDSLNSISLLAATPSSVFISDCDYRIFESTNHGATWTDRSAGLGTLSYINDSLFKVAGTTLYAVANGELYKSTDAASGWENIHPSMLYAIDALAVNGATVYAGTTWGTAKSTDQGANWACCSEALRDLGQWGFRVISLAVSGTTVYLGTKRGMFKSPDAGDSWEASNNGISGGQVNYVGAGENNLYATLQGSGVYTGTNGGATWTKNPTLPYIRSILRDDTVLYAATTDGVYKSGDDGTTWLNTTTGLNLAFPYASSLAVHRNTLYASFPAIEPSGGIFKTTNEGVNWQTNRSLGSDNGQIRFIAIIDDTLFAVTDRGLYQRAVYGWTWKRVDLSQDLWPIYALAGNGGTIYLANGSGIHMSTNRGTTWVSALTDFPVSSIAFMGSAVYAGIFSGGVYTSTLGDTNWTAVNNGLAVGAIPWWISSLAVTGSTLYAGTIGFGVLEYKVVLPPTIVDITPPALGEVGLYYHHAYKATGTLPITYRLASGALPPGLQLSEDGVISGIPTDTGFHRWNISATNSEGTVLADETTLTIIEAEKEMGGSLGFGDILLLMLITAMYSVRRMKLGS